MSTRISTRMMTSQSLASLQAAQSRTAQLQQQMTSGNALSKPSDNPTAANTAIRTRTAIGVNQQYSDNNADGQAWLDTQDGALQSSVDVLSQARSLTVQASSTGNHDTTAMNAIATQIEALKQNLLAAANTKYGDRSVFTGTSTAQAAFDDSGAYQGDSGSVTRRIGPGVDVAVNVPGSTTFAGSTGNTIFQDLDAVVAAIRSGNTADVSASLDKIDAGLSSLKQAQATVGARTNQLSSMQSVTSARATTLQGQLSDVQDVDPAKVFVEFTQQNVAYQAALSATAKLIQPSLLDFLS